MTTTRLHSMLLASADPERLHGWYTAALQPEHDTRTEGYRLLSFGGFTILLDRRDDVGRTNPEPGRAILNFEVADARAAVRRLDALGVAWKARLEEREAGRFATAIDPDGNYVQIIQLDAGRGPTASGGTGVLAAAPAFGGFSVDDLAAAREFYVGVLGLRASEANGVLTLHLCGGWDVLVYPEPTHAPAGFTILTFPVPDVDAAVRDLAAQGVRCERDGRRIARFTDPAGNVLAVLQPS